jgi:hypothetical protein
MRAQGPTTNGINPGAGISRSYLTVHLQPYRRVSFDIYHNYFRCADRFTALIGTDWSTSCSIRV